MNVNFEHLLELERDWAEKVRAVNDCRSSGDELHILHIYAELARIARDRALEHYVDRFGPVAPDDERMKAYRPESTSVRG
jgi:hypothetical protein